MCPEDVRVQVFIERPDADATSGECFAKPLPRMLAECFASVLEREIQRIFRVRSGRQALLQIGGGVAFELERLNAEALKLDGKDGYTMSTVVEASLSFWWRTDFSDCRPGASLTV